MQILQQGGKLLYDPNQQRNIQKDLVVQKSSQLQITEHDGWIQLHTVICPWTVSECVLYKKLVLFFWAIIWISIVEHVASDFEKTDP